MTKKIARALVAIALAVLAASPAAAANREHQQLMADIRMLQEQAQQLQNLIGALNEVLKTVNARLDDQANANRKAFADEKLIIDNLSNDLRVVREKVDDSNVRVGSVAQEVDALRQLVQQALSRPVPTATTEVPDPNAPPGSAPVVPPPAPTASTGIGTSPTKAFDTAMADYWAGQWDLAILGFEAFIRDFPRSDQADDAQLNIGHAYLQDGKNEKAVEAYDKVIRNYPQSNSVPDAYYRKGLALLNLGERDRAREAFEYVVKNYRDSTAATQAVQRLSSISKP